MNTPVRLDKKTKTSFEDKIKNELENFINSHAHLILFVLFAILFSLFICLICVLTGVSATESGLQYNHLKDVI